jgi:hypothetical protein
MLRRQDPHPAAPLIFPLPRWPRAASFLRRLFPAKPIKLVIAFPAGGPTDITMRQLADNASKILGQPVVVENKPGAGGTLPAQLLQTSQPTATRWRRSRWACSACRTPPRSTGTRSRTSTTSSTSPAMPSASWCRPTARQELERLRRVRQGQPGQAELRLHRHADQPAPDHRADRAEAGHPAEPHSVQGQRRPGRRRHQRRPHHGRRRFHRLRAAGEAGKLRVLNTWGEKRLDKFPDAPTLKELGMDIVQNSPFGIGAPRARRPTW